jgi:prevent-host-death family protein
MREVGVHEAKTQLSKLLREVETGAEILIMRGNEPVARLVPARPPRTRAMGIDKGRFTVPDDFDAPLPDALLDDFDA